ncbi:hypothetical protein [Brachyspira hyodysenteriae]|uniref:hypothetical protein n=1 Tax=Brachyspira hyodysenteriae TaxID=159 RepID=UPI0015C4416C|nr:hypothetical protein [Brachyspira hyodysenteriae]
MTKEEAKKLGHGVFNVFWKSGGSSYVAVGSLHPLLGNNYFIATLTCGLTTV